MYLKWGCEQAINAPAHQVKWTRGDDWKNLYLRMGGLHISTNFTNTIGDHMADSELAELWVAAGITSPGIADKVLSGKDYKAGMRLHRLTWQAGWRIIMDEFVACLKDDAPDVYQDIEVPSRADSDTLRPLVQRIESPDFRDMFMKFIAVKAEHKTFNLFLRYLDMVQMLL